MVTKTSQLLSAGKTSTTGAAVKAFRTADPKTINALKHINTKINSVGLNTELPI